MGPNTTAVTTTAAITTKPDHHFCHFEERPLLSPVLFMDPSTGAAVNGISRKNMPELKQAFS